jgi:hypothetical protein
MRRANSSRRAVSWPGRSSSFLHFRIQPPGGRGRGDRVSCVNLAPTSGIVESLHGVLPARLRAAICAISGRAYSSPFAPTSCPPTGVPHAVHEDCRRRAGGALRCGDRVLVARPRRDRAVQLVVPVCSKSHLGHSPENHHRFTRGASLGGGRRNPPVPPRARTRFHKRATCLTSRPPTWGAHAHTRHTQRARACCPLCTCKVALDTRSCVAPDLLRNAGTQRGMWGACGEHGERGESAISTLGCLRCVRVRCLDFFRGTCPALLSGCRRARR